MESMIDSPHHLASGLSGPAVSCHVNSRLAVADRHLQEGEAGDDDIQWMTDTSAAAAEKRAQEQLTAAMAGMVTQGNIEAEQEAARKREEKRKAEEEVARQVSRCSLKAVPIAAWKGP